MFRYLYKKESHEINNSKPVLVTIKPSSETGLVIQEITSTKRLNNLLQ